MEEHQISAANLKSLESGAKGIFLSGYGRENTTAVRTLRAWREPRPPYPPYTSKFSASLWRLAVFQYEQRKLECSGTGDKRMEIELRYMSRPTYDAKIRDVNERGEKKQAELADQL